MTQPKIHKRSSTRFTQLILDSLQHILVLLAFAMFFSYIQVVAAQSVSIQTETIAKSASYLSLLIGTISLVLALVVKWISQKCLSRIGFQAKEYLQ